MTDRQNILVSVIMANYNTPIEYLKESINSILNQTHSNFELLIIDDGSTDDSLKYIENIQDERITILRNEKNMGLAYSRNRELDIAKGKYIAIMDSDDISEPTRFEKQVEFMENHPNVIVCESWTRYFSKDINDVNSWIYKPVIDDMEFFKIRMVYGNYIVNPAVMLNRSLIEKGNIRYKEYYTAAQDSRMWVDCAEVGDFAVFPEMLLNYRVHGQSTTKSNRPTQKKFLLETSQYQLKKLHYDLTEEKKEFFPYKSDIIDMYDLRTKKLLKDVIKANNIYNVYNQKKFKDYSWQLWIWNSAYEITKHNSVFHKAKIIFHFLFSRFIPFTKKVIDVLQTRHKLKNT